MNYADRLRSRTQKSDRFGAMRPPSEFKDYYRTVEMKNVAEGRYPSRLIPPSPSKWPVTPACIFKHRVEVDKGEKPTWILGSESFYDGLGLGDPHQIIDRLLLGLNDLCWVIEEVERNGKMVKFGNWKFPRKLREASDYEDFVRAVSLISPMRNYAYLLLVRGVLAEVTPTKLPEPGKSVWKTYSLTPTDNSVPIEEWVPIYLEVGATGFYNDFVDAIDTAEGFTKGRYDVWDRQRGANFVIKRGKAHSYSVVAKANTDAPIPSDLWKELLADKHYPSLKNKIGWMTRNEASTDAGITKKLEESWWFGKLLKYVPKIAEYLDGDHDARLEAEGDYESEDEDEF